ncbi:hypothetical protein S7335_1371 [Synechococcus sp. PCC 7335]|nr:hypothetical protein S7335_1371 [Synechococcus sp. PCC 7335]
MLLELITRTNRRFSKASVSAELKQIRHCFFDSKSAINAF